MQHLLHQLKYKGRKEVGVFLGRLMGYEFKESGWFDPIDVIVPVPLHESKLKKRGYNQSEMLARGLAEAMNAQLDLFSLFRRKASETQTRKSRFKRWENVKDIFEVKSSDHLAGKHLLLVDDVVTTGATLEACSAAILNIPSVRLSVATIAYASL